MMDESILKLVVGDLRVRVRIQPNLKILEIQLLDMLPQMEFIGSTTYSVWLENLDPPAGKSVFLRMYLNFKYIFNLLAIFNRSLVEAVQGIALSSDLLCAVYPIFGVFRHCLVLDKSRLLLTWFYEWQELIGFFELTRIDMIVSFCVTWVFKKQF